MRTDGDIESGLCSSLPAGRLALGWALLGYAGIVELCGGQSQGNDRLIKSVLFRHAREFRPHTFPVWLLCIQRSGLGELQSICPHRHVVWKARLVRMEGSRSRVIPAEKSRSSPWGPAGLQGAAAGGGRLCRLGQGDGAAQGGQRVGRAPKS